MTTEPLSIVSVCWKVTQWRGPGMGAGGVRRETSVRGGRLRKGREGVAGREACEGRATGQQEQCEGLGHTLCTEEQQGSHGWRRRDPRG